MLTEGRLTARVIALQSAPQFKMVPIALLSLTE